MLTEAMQRTMTASTSYTTSPKSSLQVRWAIPQRRAKAAPVTCGSYNRQQNCNSRYGPQRGPFGPMMFGDGAQAAAQVAELMQQFAKSMNSNNSPNYSNPSPPTGFLPVDIEEQEGQYILNADIPGLQKSDLKISVNQADQTLKISGERQRAKPVETTDANAKQSQSQFRKQYERGMGKFSRTISMMPKDADLSAVGAKVDKGVLTITVQKKDLAKDEQTIRIDID